MQTDFDETAVKETIGRWVDAIAGSLDADAPVAIVGVRTRGETLAERIAVQLAERGFKAIRRGVLDITLYRDDLSEIGPRAVVRPTEITAEIDGIPVVLVDDVLFTGRSVRAALNELSDFGRPSAVRLAVLVDRGGRELPIQPDFVGVNLRDVPATSRVHVLLKENDGRDAIVVKEQNSMQ